MTLRRTYPACALVRAMLHEPRGEFWGYQLMERTGVGSGALYPVLSRLVSLGWLTADTQPSGPTDRRTRRYYRWTDEGPAAARAWLTAEPIRSAAVRDVLAADPLPAWEPADD